MVKLFGDRRTRPHDDLYDDGAGGVLLIADDPDNRGTGNLIIRSQPAHEQEIRRFVKGTAATISETKVKQRYPKATAQRFEERWSIHTGVDGEYEPIGYGATEKQAWDIAVLWIGDK